MCILPRTFAGPVASIGSVACGPASELAKERVLQRRAFCRLFIVGFVGLFVEESIAHEHPCEYQTSDKCSSHKPYRCCWSG